MTIALLAVECGVAYRLEPRADLSVAENVGTHWADGVGYRISARGLNHCCAVDVQILNLGPHDLVVVPGAATLTSKRCGVIDSRWIGYADVRGVSSFDAAEKQLEVRATRSDLWQEVSNRAEQLAVPPRTFLAGRVREGLPFGVQAVPVRMANERRRDHRRDVQRAALNQ